MPTVSTRARVSYTPGEMYALVNDVKSYPAFIPMCSDVRLLSEGADRLKATMTLKKGAIRLTFTTENSMEAGRHIRMRLVDGPFKRLNGLWTFTPQGDSGSETAFRLDFEFANGLLSMALGGFFKEVSESMVDAFCRQAAKNMGQESLLEKPRCPLKQRLLS